MVTYMKLFQISDLLPSFCQYFFHILQGNSGFYHHNKEMVDQIVDFICSIFIFPILCRNDHFTAFFSAFLQDLIQSLLKKITGVISLPFLSFSLLDSLLQSF